MPRPYSEDLRSRVIRKRDEVLLPRQDAQQQPNEVAHEQPNETRKADKESPIRMMRIGER